MLRALHCGPAPILIGRYVTVSQPICIFLYSYYRFCAMQPNKMLTIVLATGQVCGVKGEVQGIPPGNYDRGVKGNIHLT